MALRQINQANTAATQQQHGEEERTSRRSRNERNNRRDEEIDDVEAEREELRGGIMSIRAATANKFGERSNPTRALTALAKYAKGYIESKVRSKDLDYDVVIVEKDVAVPSVVVVSRTEATGEDGKPLTVCVGHAIMLVDYSRTPEPLEVVREGSITYEEPTVWADAYDAEYVEAIEDALINQLDNVELLVE